MASIDIDDVKKIKLVPGEILLVEFDTSPYPHEKKRQMLEHIYNIISQKVPAGVQVMVVPKGKYSFSSITPDALNGASDAKQESSQDAYDRAMRGIG
jgi:hypothetical protein